MSEPLLADDSINYGTAGAVSITDSNGLPRVPAEEPEDSEAIATPSIELKYFMKAMIPMMLSFFLQYSEQFAGVFSIGHLGRLQLASASLAAMTATITGLTIFTGISTALETLCSQAYGRGQKHELGLHLQRCLLLELLCFIPISVVWLNTETIMLWLRQDPDLARLSGSFLKIHWFGAPGYAIFEALKRFQQAQNIFHASTYVLLITAPLNVVCLVLNILLPLDRC
ncbi:hypothetical protein VP1G_06156 [Cytospora mali]|uniref:Uncharacterized protein n=1 Tax=Cytospora mali TaxID=578113 RepID=A0A194V4U0_CYTMA|nr:hypothetical protein VP1G_06156 [Valsa mali var. pyri (nom. inval.)]